MSKRLLLIGLLVVGVALLSGCELIDQLIDQIAGGGTGGGTTSGVVNFPDPGLEAAIRGMIAKPTGDILHTDLIALKHLTAVNQDIVNLEGIQHCTNLTSLNLRWNQIVDISHLSGLTNLTSLNLGENHQIVNISPLSGLTNLTWLYLYLNQIVDISPLSGLINLTELSLADNQIVNISPLSSLINLTRLDLDRTQIADIAPLVNNAGINSGDIVLLSYNNLCLSPGSPDQLAVDALLSRGVDVGYHDQTCL